MKQEDVDKLLSEKLKMANILVQFFLRELKTI